VYIHRFTLCCRDTNDYIQSRIHDDGRKGVLIPRPTPYYFHFPYTWFSSLAFPQYNFRHLHNRFTGNLLLLLLAIQFLVDLSLFQKFPSVFCTGNHFLLFCGLFLQHCLTLYSFDGRKIYVKVWKLSQGSGRDLIETLSVQMPERTDGNIWKPKRGLSFYVQNFELGLLNIG